MSETRTQFEKWAMEYYYEGLDEAIAPARATYNPNWYADDDVQEAWLGWKSGYEAGRLAGMEQAAKIAEETMWASTSQAATIVLRSAARAIREARESQKEAK